jgi:acyl-CoA thioesterase-1
MQRISLALWGFLLGCALTNVTPAWSQAAKGAQCEMPTELLTPAEPLAFVTSSLSNKGSLDILAIGSGSTVGNSGALAGPAFAFRAVGSSFPYRMLGALRSMRPAQRFTLTVKGGRSMTAEAMLPILRQELATHHYDLVLWQTGTVEAVRGLRPDMLRGALDDGVEAAVAAHADVVLIDAQFSRFLRANADLGPYETVLRQIATKESVTLFPRLALTEVWVDDGSVDLERVSKDARDVTIARLQICLGQALAQYVLAGAAEH